VLATAPQEKPVLTTQAYSKQLADADAVIQKIVRENLARSHG
jgi:membrane fusion protein (multidrug efflux system)